MIVHVSLQTSGHETSSQLAGLTPQWAVVPEKKISLKISKSCLQQCHTEDKKIIPQTCISVTIIFNSLNKNKFFEALTSLLECQSCYLMTRIKRWMSRSFIIRMAFNLLSFLHCYYFCVFLSYLRFLFLLSCSIANCSLH